MQKLFTEFSPTTAIQWKEQLIKDLKGIDYTSLVWKTNSGIDIKPFYTKEDITSSKNPIFEKNDWAICENIIVLDELAANKQALNALQNGASGLVFHIHKKTDFNTLLNDILLQHIYSLFIVSAEFKSELTNFLNSITTGNNCFLECDRTLDGNIDNTTNTVTINTNLYQEAGSNTINELAFSLAHLNEYLNSTKTPITNVHINMCVGGDFFTEIAKTRALRQLTTFLLNQYSLNASIHIHAKTTLINKSNIDSYNNMLRTTTESMSACIGGANSILVLPFDIEFNNQNDFSSRMARNQQLILKDESYLNIVSDISAGSYYIESLTETLCEKAWEHFKLIESKGGLLACLKSNYVQDVIAKDAEILINQFKNGNLILVGVNKFQNKLEDLQTLKKHSTVHPSGIKSINLSEFVEQ